MTGISTNLIPASSFTITALLHNLESHCSMMSSLCGAKKGDRHPASETDCFSLVLLGLQFHIITEWIIALRDDSRSCCRLINLVVKCLTSSCLPVKHIQVRDKDEKKTVGIKTRGRILAFAVSCDEPLWSHLPRTIHALWLALIF